MITKYHTDIEKRDELFKDRFEIMEYANKVVSERKEYIRGYKTAKRFPYYYSTHYKSRTGNRYTVTLTATDKKKGGSNPILSFYTTMDTEEGKYMFRYDIINNVITMFTPHFFKRYRERFLNNENLSVDRIIELFDRNNIAKAKTDEEGVWIGSDGYFMGKSVADGLDICVTYVSFRMLREDQLDRTEQGLAAIRQYKMEEIDI